MLSAFDIASQRLEAGQTKFKTAGLTWMLRGTHKILLQAACSPRAHMFVTSGPDWHHFHYDHLLFALVCAIYYKCKLIFFHLDCTTLPSLENNGISRAQHTLPSDPAYRTLLSFRRNEQCF